MATCAEVSVTPNGAVKVLRAVVAFECGAVVNPEHLRNQVEGAVVMGIGGALFEQIEFADGKILNQPAVAGTACRASADMPVIESVLLDRKDLVRRAPAKRRSWASRRPSATPSSTPPASACVRFR